jgi:ABC-type antimicrobial peptide transport system permease subunit
VDRLIAIITNAFGFIASLLASIGACGVVAYSLSLRTSEFGIRIALGVVRLLSLCLCLRTSAGMVVAGLAAGSAGALALARAPQSLLSGVGSLEKFSLLLSLLILSLVILIACAVPACRAANIDSIRALRCE